MHDKYAKSVFGKIENEIIKTYSISLNFVETASDNVNLMVLSVLFDLNN